MFARFAIFSAAPIVNFSTARTSGKWRTAAPFRAANRNQNRTSASFARPPGWLLRRLNTSDCSVIVTDRLQIVLVHLGSAA